MSRHDCYDLGYRDGYLGIERLSPEGSNFMERQRYANGYADGRSALSGGWRYAYHAQALSIPVDAAKEEAR